MFQPQSNFPKGKAWILVFLDPNKNMEATGSWQSMLLAQVFQEALQPQMFQGGTGTKSVENCLEQLILQIKPW